MKLALVGYGYWGHHLARNITQCPETELVAVVDQDSKKLEEAKSKHSNIQILDSLQTLLERDTAIDAVVIATPPRDHESSIRLTLQFNKHVLVEKPMTLDSVTAEQLVHEAKIKGKVLCVDHTVCYSGAIKALKTQLAKHPQNSFVSSTRLNVAPNQVDKSGCSVLWDLASHDVGVIDYLLSVPAISVQAWGTKSSAIMRVRYLDDIYASISVSWDSTRRSRSLSIAGPNWHYSYDGLNDTANVPGGIDTNIQEPLQNLIVAFAKAIKNEVWLVTDGYHGLRVVKIIEAAQRSLDKGGVIQFV